MPATAKTIVDAALAEWERWGQARWDVIRNEKTKPFDNKKNPTGHHTDKEDQYAKLVREEYCRFVIKDDKRLPSLDDIKGIKYAWSAVAISFIIARAGFTKAEFHFSQSHSRYIRDAVAARKSEDGNAPYWGYRVTEEGAKPEIGDLVGYARSENEEPTFNAAQKFFDKTKSYLSHTDIVVAKRSGEIDVIGGNVRQTVMKKTLQLGSDGLLADRTMPWFVVMKLRS